MHWVASTVGQGLPDVHIDPIIVIRLAHKHRRRNVDFRERTNYGRQTWYVVFPDFHPRPRVQAGAKLGTG
jgi:hypothetical protein